MERFSLGAFIWADSILRIRLGASDSAHGFDQDRRRFRLSTAPFHRLLSYTIIFSATVDIGLHFFLAHRIMSPKQLLLVQRLRCARSRLSGHRPNPKGRNRGAQPSNTQRRSQNERIGSSSHKVERSEAWKAGLIGGGVAVAVNVLWYGLAKAIGVSFLAYIGPGGEPAVIPAGMVIFASFAGAAAAPSSASPSLACTLGASPCSGSSASCSCSPRSPARSAPRPTGRRKRPSFSCTSSPARPSLARAAAPRSRHGAGAAEERFDRATGYGPQAEAALQSGAASAHRPRFPQAAVSQGSAAGLG